MNSDQMIKMKWLASFLDRMKDNVNITDPFHTATNVTNNIPDVFLSFFNTSNGQNTNVHDTVAKAPATRTSAEMEHGEEVASVLLLTCGLLAALANALVLYISLYHLKSRNVLFIIITNFALIDEFKALCAIYMAMTFFLSDYGSGIDTSHEILYYKLIQLSLFVFYFGNICSVLNLILAVINEFLYIKMPLQYTKVVNKWRAFIAVLIIWLVSLSFSLLKNLHSGGQVANRVWVSYDWENVTNTGNITYEYHRSEKQPSNRDIYRPYGGNAAIGDIYALIMAAILIVCLFVVAAMYLGLYYSVRKALIYRQENASVKTTISANERSKQSSMNKKLRPRLSSYAVESRKSTHNDPSHAHSSRQNASICSDSNTAQSKRSMKLNYRLKDNIQNTSFSCAKDSDAIIGKIGKTGEWSQRTSFELPMSKGRHDRAHFEGQGMMPRAGKSWNELQYLSRQQKCFSQSPPRDRNGRLSVEKLDSVTKTWTRPSVDKHDSISSYHERHSYYSGQETPLHTSRGRMRRSSRLLRRHKCIIVILTVCCLYLVYLSFYFSLKLFHVVHILHGLNVHKVHERYIIQLILRSMFVLQASLNPLIFFRIKTFRTSFICFYYNIVHCGKSTSIHYNRPSVVEFSVPIYDN